MEGFQINYTDLSDLFWEYKRKIENLIENIDNCIERINMFTENAVFTGKTGDAVKSYLGEAHITILSGIKVTAQTLLDNMAAYKDGYRAIDSSTNFKLDEEAIQEFRKKLASNYEDTDEYTGKIRSALSEVSDISDVGMPDSNGVFDIHEQMDSDLIKLVSNVNSYERENVVRLENSVELLLENLQSCLSKIGLSQGAIESYKTGSFITGKDAGTLNTGIKIFGDLHEKNKEAYDEIYETEQKIKDEAEKRKTQGIWRMVGGAVLIATGAACIVLTGGAATPIVADVAVAAGSGTAVFGAADAIEGTQDIYYGSTGDIDSTAVNGIKDDLFQGNEDAYYLTENAFAFAASAMIPIGQASTAGNLTFKSTATIVAKEGISMGAGAGAQKITTDVTGNDTAGMVAGMVASGVTAKGLNGIEAEVNKLAKAPKGIDGVTEGAGNLAEDVGKIVEGGTDVLDEIKRVDEIKVEFNYNSKYDEAEFARQLADQQKGMNELTVQEYLDNRQKYIEQGRAIESNAAQQAAREKAFVDKVDELQDAGLSLKEAEEQAEKWLDTQAAVHNPDQVAGGYASNVGGVGDKGVNSSIGSQWRYRIDDVDAQIKKMAESMFEAEKNSTYLNVKLVYKGD